MALVRMGSMWDLVQSHTSLVEEERQRIIDWLRAHDDQHERAIAAGALYSRPKDGDKGTLGSTSE